MMVLNLVLFGNMDYNFSTFDVNRLVQIKRYEQRINCVADLFSGSIKIYISYFYIKLFFNLIQKIF